MSVPEDGSVLSGPRFWWVNQGPTLALGYSFDVLWASLTDPNGHRVSHWDALTEMRAGDFTLHYANGSLRGVGLVLGPSREVERPPEWAYEGRASDSGRQIQAKYQATEHPLLLDAIPLARRKKQQGPSPFNVAGGVKRGYVFGLDTGLALEVLDLLGLIASREELDELYEPSDEDAREFVFLRSTDKTVTVKARGGQGALRRFLFGARAHARCGFCGDRLPVALLHAAHIKKRSKCSDDERRDGNVVMAACLLGCDALFEQGHISVGTAGQILVAADAPARATRRLVGMIAPAHRPETESYFAWHRTHSY